jgi:HEAT repeat protein
MKLSPAELVALVKKPDATTFEKAKACQRLASVGTKDAVPAVAPLLADAQLAHYARYALEGIPDPSADDALRAALPKLKGLLLVGVINSLGQRRDARAAAPLSKLIYDADPQVAQAAAAALGRISGAQAAKTLQESLSRTKGPVRMAVADACLVCAEGLLAQGDRAQALALYNTLTAADVPKPVRLAAMHAIIGAETSLSRPR